MARRNKASCSGDSWRKAGIERSSKGTRDPAGRSRRSGSNKSASRATSPPASPRAFSSWAARRAGSRRRIRPSTRPIALTGSPEAARNSSGICPRKPKESWICRSVGTARVSVGKGGGATREAGAKPAAGSDASTCTGTTSGMIPSKAGSMSRMRSLMGGCVENRNSMKPPDEAKKRCCDSRSAFEPARFAPDIPATFFKAEARPSGLRVNWTAEASARYSR